MSNISNEFPIGHFCCYGHGCPMKNKRKRPSGVHVADAADDFVEAGLPWYRSRALRRRPLLWATVLMCILVAGFGLAPVDAQDTIEDARSRQKELEEQELQAKAGLASVEAEFSEVQAAFEAADELVKRQEAAVSAAQLQLEAAKLRQRQIEVAIGWAEYDLTELDDAIVNVAIEAYLGDVQGDSTTLLQSEDLQEATTKIAMLELASTRSEDVVDLVRGIRERQLALESEQVFLISEIEGIEGALADDLVDLQERLAHREELRDRVAAVVREWQSRLADIEAEDLELTRFIANKQALAAGRQPSISDVSTDGYIWPTAGGAGSGFGQRLHPILGYYRMHSGLDIGGAQGQPIYASNSGTVIVAQVQGGYGNAIVLDHGEGLSSLYAHQSRFNVSVGDKVNRGDVIGFVGSTGMSTGPHLHYEIRLFGTPIDPMPFMP